METCLLTLPFCVSLLRHWVSLKRAQERAIWVVFFHSVLYGFYIIVSSYPVDFSSFFNKSENPLEAAVCRVVPVTPSFMLIGVNFLYVNWSRILAFVPNPRQEVAIGHLLGPGPFHFTQGRGHTCA